MKKNRTFLKFILIVSAVMFGLTILLLYLSTKRAENDSYIQIDTDTMKLIQLEPPKDGAPIAVVDTTLGEFRFVLYPEQSPEAVKNFTSLAESGYYDNTYIYNAEEGVYASAGSKLKSGEMPEGYDKAHEVIERELSQDLWPFKGAVCMLNTEKESTFKNKLMGGGKYFNGSRFALIDSIEFTDEMKEQLLDISGSQELGEAFIKNGGVPNFSQQMTVIGQTYEGIEVIDAITRVKTENDGHNKRPVDDIMINSVKIDKYKVQ